MSEKIGPHDGIVAFHNAMRYEQPERTVLKKNANGKWPDMWAALADVPLDQWEAIDQHQRTEQILVDAHDAAEEAEA